MLDITLDLPATCARTLRSLSAADHCTAETHRRKAKGYAGNSRGHRVARLMRHAVREESRARELLTEARA